MAFPKCLFLLLGLLCSLSQLHSTLAALYKVRDINGKWGVDNYFQIGDSLSFAHHTESASVHQVSREDYKACETESPIKTFKGGDNVADLKEGSTYYFISGKKHKCMEGRKLVVVVLASAPAATPGGAPSTPPTVKTPSPSVVASPTPLSSSPPASSPVVTPVLSPVATPPTPVSSPPSPSATPSISTTPSSASSPSPSEAPASSAGPPSPPVTPSPAPPPSPPSAAPYPLLRTWLTFTASGISSALVLLL